MQPCISNIIVRAIRITLTVRKGPIRTRCARYRIDTIQRDLVVGERLFDAADDIEGIIDWGAAGKITLPLRQRRYGRQDCVARCLYRLFPAHKEVSPILFYWTTE